MSETDAAPERSPEEIAFLWAIYRRRMVAYWVKTAAGLVACLCIVPLIGMIRYDLAAGPLGDFKPSIYDCLVWFLVQVFGALLLAGIGHLVDMYTDLAEQRGCVRGTAICD